jgi:hypothetical protein
MNKPAEMNGSASTRPVCVSPSCPTSRGAQSDPGAVDRIWRARGHHLKAARSRLKLAIEMSGDTEVYMLDEPTSGLHMHDIDNLIGPPGPAGRERAHGNRHRAQPRRRGTRPLGGHVVAMRSMRHPEGAI